MYRLGIQFSDNKVDVQFAKTINELSKNIII